METKEQLQAYIDHMGTTTRAGRRGRMNKEYWIVEGRVTCQEAADTYGCNVGDVEWCFSDGHIGKRGYSADYHDILKGLAEHSPAVFHVYPIGKEE